MSRIFPIVLGVTMAVVFCRCGGRIGHTDVKAAGDSIVTVTDAAADTLSPVQGIWVSKTYLDTLRATGSPRAAQMVADESCLNFSASIREPVHVVWHFHEGGEYRIIRENKKDILYDPNDKQDMGEIELLTPTQIRIGHNYFVKLWHPDPGNYDYDIVEELLFAVMESSNGNWSGRSRRG